MEEQSTNESVAATEEAAPVTEAPTTETVTKPVLESDSGAPFQLDNYEQRIESLLSNHETSKKTKTAEEKEAKRQETLREGESWQSVLESAPEEVQRAMSSLRADYTRKTQALAQQRKELAQQQQALTNSDAFKQIQEIAQSESGEFDPFDPESFNKYVNKVVAERLSGILEPMRQEQMQFQAQTKLDTFMNEHPELRTDEGIRQEVHQTLSENEHLDLEAAYWIVNGRRAKAQQQASAARVKRTKKAARSAGLTVGSGRKSGITAPKDETMKAWDIYEHLLQQN
jgi:hypothetical protein